MRDLIRSLSPLLDLIEECENQLKKIYSQPCLSEEATEVGQQILMLQQDYEEVLKKYA